MLFNWIPPTQIRRLALVRGTEKKSHAFTLYFKVVFPRDLNVTTDPPFAMNTSQLSKHLIVNEKEA